MRKIGFVLAAALAPLMSGCAEFVTVLAGVSDELNAEQGNYYADQHFTETMEGDCPALAEHGRANNQTYWRVRNTGSAPATYTLRWSSGYEQTTYLDPGETSQYFYMTPSVTPNWLGCERSS